MSADRELALRCWEVAKESLLKVGRDPQGLIVHQDQDTVYTSYDWLRTLLIEDGVVVSYCERGAKDNPWMESFWGHFKRENASLLLEAATLEELWWVIGRQVDYYNYERRHSSFGYRSPMEYLTGEGLIANNKILVKREVKSGSVYGLPQVSLCHSYLPPRAVDRGGGVRGLMGRGEWTGASAPGVDGGFGQRELAAR